jgi:DNA polymerase
MLDPRRRACLRAMGIDVWVERAPAPAVPENRVGVDFAAGAAGADRATGSDFPGAVRPAGSSVKIDSGPVTSEPVAPKTGTDAFSPADRISSLDWDALRKTVAGCRACGLCETRTQTVFGTGAHDADLMIVGEAPGAEEDRQGEPFVGRAGQLLNAMLAAIGLERGRVYIANIVKCRPPGNRDPHAEEAAACRAYLLRQVTLLQPRLILSVGRVSAQNLLGSEESVGRLRGRVHRFEPGDVPLIVTYHPAYLLRKPSEKAKAWQDLQAAHRVLHGAD